jgi:hypothetical protein
MSKEKEFQDKIRDIEPEDSEAVGALITQIYGKSPLIEHYESLDEAGKKVFDEKYNYTSNI